MLQWSPRQVHDTVAAIAREIGLGERPQSLLGRMLRFIVARISSILDWVRGSVDARLLLAATIVVIVVLVYARVVAERRAAEARQSRAGARATRGERRDRWRAADELAASGRYGDATHELYAAVVESLAIGGLVRYHASKTNGDYARELRRAGAPVAAEFRAFGRRFDRAVFATSETTREEYVELAALAASIGRIARQRPAA